MTGPARSRVSRSSDTAARLRQPNCYDPPQEGWGMQHRESEFWATYGEPILVTAALMVSTIAYFVYLLLA